MKRRLAAMAAAALLVGLLPATASAVGPTAVADHLSVPVNAAATTLDVLANDIGMGLSIDSAGPAGHGTVVVAVDGQSVTYQPDALFHDTDTFQYTITDGDMTDIGTVTVDVNSRPVAVPDPGSACQTPSLFGGGYPVPEDFHTAGPPADYFLLFGNCALLHNDTDPDGDPLTWEIVSQPANGDVIKVDEEFFGYKPHPDYGTASGDLPGHTWHLDTFTYRAFDGFAFSAPATMSFWVAAINDPPTFSPGPSTVSVAEDSGPHSASWATNVSAGPPNESDQTVHFEVETDLNGVPNLFSVPPAMAADGTLTFTPAPDQVGLVHVTVRAKDDGGLEDYDLGPVMDPPDDTSDDANFDIVVTPVEDAPTALDDVTVVGKNSGATPIDVLANDSDPDAGDVLSITSKTDGTKGSVVITSGGTGLTYEPSPDVLGPDTFTYTIGDGHGGTDTATVSVAIADGSPPVAVADAMTLAEDPPNPVFKDVLINDSDPDHDPLTIQATTNGSKGVVAITGGGTGLTYKPNANANGADSFTYTVADGNGWTTTGSVSVTITPVNDRPNAVNDASFTVPESAGARSLPVLANDTDVDGGTILKITNVTQGGRGSVAITGGGTGLTYNPNQLYYGTDVFTYTVSDGSLTDNATVLVTVVKDTVKPAVTAPVASFYGQTVGSSTMKARIAWSGTDTGGTGIAKYQLQVSTNGGAYATVTLASATSTSINRTLADGRSYRFRVRATDKQGNVSAYVYGPTFKPARAQNTSSSVHYSGTWVTSINSSALGGSHRYATSTGARVTFSTTTRDIAWVTTRTSTSGSAQVWIDGVFAATVNLHASSTTYRQLVFARHFTTLGSHTIELRPAGGGRVYLDAFLVYH
jgi:hypothetical protein